MYKFVHFHVGTFIHFDYSMYTLLERDAKYHEIFSDKLMLIKEYIESSKYKKAKKIIEKLPKYDFLAHYHIWINYISNKFDDVIEICDELSKKNQNIYYTNFYKGVIFSQRQEYDKAINCLQNALENQNIYDVNYSIGLTYERIGNKDKSLEYYNRCLKYNRKTPQLHLSISSLLPYHKAIEHLDIAISLNPDLYEAYIEKGKILRFFGKHEDAYEYFRKYMEYKEDMEVIKEISLCLLDMGKEESNYYISIWLRELLASPKYNQLTEGKSILITDIMWHNSQFLICTKVGEDYVVRTPLSEFRLFTNTDSEIGIGIVIDPFLDMVAKTWAMNGKPWKKGDEYIPCVTKHYLYKKDFMKVYSSIIEQDIVRLNKDYSDKNEKGETINYKEYISVENKTSILVEEFLQFMIIRVKIGTTIIDGWFKNTSDGYFSFTSKLDDNSLSDEAAILIICREAKQIIRITFNKNNISINKNVLYKRLNYYDDIKLPLY